MGATGQAVDSATAIRTRARKKPGEVEGFQGVVLCPGGPVEVLNISNWGLLVETTSRTKPGSKREVQVKTASGTCRVMAQVVRSEVVLDGGRLRYQLGIAFDEPLDLIDEDEVALQDPQSSGPEVGTDLLPPDATTLDLRFSITRSRW